MLPLMRDMLPFDGASLLRLLASPRLMFSRLLRAFVLLTTARLTCRHARFTFHADFAIRRLFSHFRYGYAFA